MTHENIYINYFVLMRCCRNCTPCCEGPVSTNATFPHPNGEYLLKHIKGSKERLFIMTQTHNLQVFAVVLLSSAWKNMIMVGSCFRTLAVILVSDLWKVLVILFTCYQVWVSRLSEKKSSDNLWAIHKTKVIMQEDGNSQNISYVTLVKQRGRHTRNQLL